MTGPIINDTPTKTKERQITIDPITRLEGQGKIEIFLNDQGNVENAYLQVPELRGFERFCIGRHVMELPVLTNRLCGVCPAAHHLASTKALDAVFSATPTPTAIKLRELFYMGQYTHSHMAHSYAPGVRLAWRRIQADQRGGARADGDHGEVLCGVRQVHDQALPRHRAGQ